MTLKSLKMTWETLKTNKKKEKKRNELKSLMQLFHIKENRKTTTKVTYNKAKESQPSTTISFSTPALVVVLKEK